ncbi:MAG: DUF3857 domain-containing transglutaminase family protein [Spirochaetes bacterium]|nr:DUF3857 domain-containing transglutaminase family protein [Spirochaetota bacterium]
MKYHILISFFIFIFSFNIYSDYIISDRSDWIIPAEYKIKKYVPDDNTEGIYYLVYDKQVKVSDGKFETYYHFVVQFQNYYGLKYLSRINIHFDPFHQQLSLHKINIIRNNKVFDKLNEKFIRIQNLYFYENFRNIFINLEDIEIGDILEYEFTLTTDNSIFDNVFFDTQLTKWDVPVGFLNYRLLVPEEKKIFINSYDTNVSYNKRKYKNFNEYQWKMKDVSPFFEEVSTPKWLDVYPYIHVSEFEKWEDVTKWAMKYYRPNYYDYKAVDIIIKDIFKGIKLESLENKITSIISYVQNDIKYLDTSYSSIPSKPAEVIKKMSGDCKDKSFLLVTMLKRAGVEAYSVLVNTDYGKVLNTFHPTPSVFNHVITLIKYNKNYYWIDPTLTMQGSKLENIYQKNYYYGLVIAPDEKKLTRMNIKYNHILDKKTMIKYKFKKNFHGHAELLIESVYNGKSAEEIRNILDIAIIRAIEKKNIRYFNSFYPNIEKFKDFEFSDNMDKNRIYTKESYLIPESWNVFHDKNKYVFKFYGFDFERYLRYPDLKRSRPLLIEYPVNIEQKISITLPKADWKIENYSEIISNNNFSFDFNVKYNNFELNIFYKFKTLNDYVSKNELYDYYMDIERINKHINFEISLEKMQAAPVAKNTTFYFILCFFIFIFFIIILPLIPDYFADFYKFINKIKIKNTALSKESVYK